MAALRSQTFGRPRHYVVSSPWHNRRARRGEKSSAFQVGPFRKAKPRVFWDRLQRVILQRRLARHRDTSHPTPIRNEDGSKTAFPTVQLVSAHWANLRGIGMEGGRLKQTSHHATAVQTCARVDSQTSPGDAAQIRQSNRGVLRAADARWIDGPAPSPRSWIERPS